MASELWKSVVGYEGLYEVSDKGNVRSLDRISTDGSRRKGRMLKPRGARYLFVTLSREAIKALPYVHRLVLEAFSGPPPVGTVGCHRDDNPRNNRLENLYWGTSAENRADAIRNGRIVLSQESALLTESDVRRIRQLRAEGATQRSVAETFGITEGTVWAMTNGRTWKHVA